MAKSFDAGLEMIEYQAKIQKLLEGAGDETCAAPSNASLGPRKPCRVCGDLSLYGIHPFCERVEIERERAALDRDDGSEGAFGAEERDEP